MDPANTSADEIAVVATVLDGLRDEVELEELCNRIGRWHRPGWPLPAEILMELAADAFLAVGSSRVDRLQLDGLAERMLPEWPARGNVGHSKRRHCVQGAVLVVVPVVVVPVVVVPVVAVTVPVPVPVPVPVSIVVVVVVVLAVDHAGRRSGW